MASISPNATSNISTNHREEEDQVVFKSSPPPNGAAPQQKTSPSQAPAPVGTGSKRSSLGIIAPQQPPFSPSPLLLSGDPSQNGGDQPTWELADRLMQMQLNPATATATTTSSSNNTGATSKEAVFPNLNDDVVNTLAPPADLTSDKQPHSRQSSSGTTAASSVQDSPTVPTPAQQKPGQGDVNQGKSFPGTDPYGAEPYNGYNPVGNDFAGATGGRSHPGATHFSPINGNFASIAGQPNQQQAASQFGFGFHSPPQSHDLSFAALNGATNGIGAGQTFNGQRPNGVANGSGFAPYGSPPPNGYPAAGMMSPTLTSPTFLPALNPYASPILPPQANPYNAYAGAAFEMPPGSPVLSAGATQSPFNAPGGATGGVGMGLGRQGPFTPPPGQYNRGRGQVIPPASAPGGTMRGGANAGGPTTPNRGGRGPRGRGAGSQMMMSPASVYPGSPYGPPLSPTPYDSNGFGAGAGQTAPGATAAAPFSPQAATNPELASLMLQMAAAGYQQGMMSPYSVANGGPGIGMNPNFMGISMGMGMFNGMPGAAGADGVPNEWGMEGRGGNWQMGVGSPSSSGPSANNRKLGLYKTELCRSFEEKGECRYGDKCQFAHGETEQRKVERHPKYKTEICRTFWVSGSCPYGKRCCFIHTELPTNAAANGGGSGAAEGASTPSGQTGGNNANGDTRNRSMSTNSDPNDPPSSLLARISAKAQANNIARSSDVSPANNGSATNNSGQPTEAVVAAAINRAMAKFGAPDPSVNVMRKLDVHPTPPPPPVEVVPVPKVPAVFSNFPVGNSSSTNGTGGLGVSGGGHHRMSASVDFGRVSRNLGSDLAAGFGGGGHARNPSASSIVPNSLLSRSPNPPLSGHSTPYGSSSTPNNGLASNGIQTSSLLDRTWA